MTYVKTEISNNKPGGTIDSWCGKCKRILAHTIEAMVGDRPARVHCNTCKAQHGYKAHEPGAGPRRPNRYQSLLKANEAAVAKTYSSKDRYEAGDVMDHPTFGRGVTTAVKDGSKIEVLFGSGSKLLVHGR